MSLAKEIARQRAKQGLTVREVAQATNLSHNAVWKAEQGTASLTVMARIARALRVPQAKIAQAALADVLRAARAAA